MDEVTTPDPGRQLIDARRHVQQVREDELRRTAQCRAEALRCLEQPLPDYSAAATACHRAYQHSLRAGVLTPVENLL
jgi:hypothetical protein